MPDVVIVLNDRVAGWQILVQLTETGNTTAVSRHRALGSPEDCLHTTGPVCGEAGHLDTMLMGKVE